MSWPEKFSVLLDLCDENPPYTDGLPNKKAMIGNLDVLLSLAVEKLKTQPDQVVGDWRHVTSL